MRTYLTEKQLLTNQPVIYSTVEFNVIQLNSAAIKFFIPYTNTSKFNLNTQFKFEVVNISSELMLDILSQKKNWNGLVSLQFNGKNTQ